MQEYIQLQARLLESIRVMQIGFLESGINYGWCEQTLNELLVLSKSEFGFICELLHEDDGRPFVRSHSITNIAWNSKVRGFYDANKKKGLDFYNFDSLWGQVFKNPVPFISNDPDNDPLRGGYPKEDGHPPLKTFLGLPIKGHGGKVIGIMAVANREDGYSMEVANFLEPFTSTYGILIEKSRQEQREKELHKKILQLACMDGLTNVSNRRVFDESIEAEWNRSKRDKLTISLLIFDIDYFKQYNDYYGHLEGDECLKKVAKALNACVNRSSDLFARYGGEEFVMLLPNTTKEQAILIAEKCRNAVLQIQIPHEKSTVNDFITISVGVASLTPSLETKSSILIETSDKFLYTAKKNGRNRVEFQK